MVEHQPSKLDTWVRFPSPASITQTLSLVMLIYRLQLNTFLYNGRCLFTYIICASGSAVEHLLAKEGVAGSIPVSRSQETQKRTSDGCSFFVFFEAQPCLKVRSSPLRSGPRKAEVPRTSCAVSCSQNSLHIKGFHLVDASRC